MESWIAEAAVDGARRQGEFWASVKIEKGKIELESLLSFSSRYVEKLKDSPILHVPLKAIIVQATEPFSICAMFIFTAEFERKAKIYLMFSICWTGSLKLTVRAMWKVFLISKELKWRVGVWGRLKRYNKS